MTPFAISGLLIVLTAIPLGLLVAHGHASRPINRTFAIFYGVTVTIWGAGALVVGTTQDPGLSLLAWKVAHVAVIFLPVMYYQFACQYTETKRPRALAVAFSYGIISTITNCIGWPYLIVVRYVFDSYYTATNGSMYIPFVLVWLALVAAAQRMLWRKYHEERDPVEKARSRLLVIGTLIGFGGGSMNFLPILGIDVYPWGNFAVPIAALSQIYAVYAYRLLDVEIAIRKTLVYSMLVGLITATYLVLVLITEKWFQGVLGYRSLAVTVLMAFGIAVGFNPLRNHIQALLDRALFKGTMEELSAQRERLLAEVRRSEQMKAVGTLAAGLAHEIKNPLTSIKAFTEHLASRHEDPQFLDKFERIVGGEVERINLIVQQLLDFAKPVPPKLRPTNIEELVEETLTLLSNELVERHIEVSRQYEGRHRVLGDPQQLKQVFLNLFLNSLDATNGAGKVEVRTEVREGNLAIDITDFGAGISQQDLPHIFTPFFTTKKTGTGLGLAVTQKIVEDHQGRISVRSVLGHGTTVTVLLPIAVS